MEKWDSAAKIIGIIASVLAAMAGGFLWLWKNTKSTRTNFVTNLKINEYNRKTGYHILSDLEKSFGKDIGITIIDYMKKVDSENITTNMRLDKLENTAGLGIYVCNTDGRCIYTNTTLATMFGMSKKDMLDYGWLKPIVDKQKAHAEWTFSINNNVPYDSYYDIEVDGVIHPCHTYAEPKMANDNRIVLGYVGTVMYRDILKN